MLQSSLRPRLGPDKPFTLPPTPVVFAPSELPHWEYHVVTIDLREAAPLDTVHLNELGGGGWLLVGMHDEPTRAGAAPRIHYYFVRAAA
jgi:hypothetical protein